MRAAILFSIFMLCNIWAKGQGIKDKCILKQEMIIDLNLELPSRNQINLFDSFRITHMLPIDMINCVGRSTYAWNLAIGKIIVTTKETEGSSTLLYNIILYKTTYR